MGTLAQKSCRPLAKGTPALSQAAIDAYLTELSGWGIEAGTLVKTFAFQHYHQTVAFVNAVAWVAQREDHHPQLLLDYGSCRVAYSTHSVGGLSENDFICAAKIETLCRL